MKNLEDNRGDKEVHHVIYKFSEGRKKKRRSPVIAYEYVTPYFLVHMKKTNRALDKREYLVIIFLSSHRNHIL